MLYIHQSACISHQPTFNEVELDNLMPSENNRLYAIEPKYAGTGIPLGHLRRMGRAVRMGVASGLTLLNKNELDGIIVGTGNGGIEDSIKFLNQIIDYDEGTLTPTNFVQSTFNAIAGQLGILNKNNGYNITHVHRGLAFENALLDAVMRLKEFPEHQYLVGGVDEISEKNDHMEELAGWYKKETTPNTSLYDSDTPGTLFGEGAAMFVVNNQKEDAVAELKQIKMLSTTDEKVVLEQLQQILNKTEPDLFLSGANGDNSMASYFNTCENAVQPSTGIARFKHITGEFQTAAALSVWLACYILEKQSVPEHMAVRNSSKEIRKILIYNNYKGSQHSFLLISRIR